MLKWVELGESLSLPPLFLAYLQEATISFNDDVWWFRLARDCWLTAGGREPDAELAGQAFLCGAYAANVIDDISDETRDFDPPLLNGAVALSHLVPILLTRLGDVINRSPAFAIQGYHEAVLQMTGGQHLGFAKDDVSLERAEQLILGQAAWFIWGCTLHAAYFEDSSPNLADFGRTVGLAHQLYNDWEALCDPSGPDARTQKPSVPLAYAHHIVATEAPPETEGFQQAWCEARTDPEAAKTVQCLTQKWGGAEYLRRLQTQILSEAEASSALRAAPSLQEHLTLLKIP